MSSDSGYEQHQQREKERCEARQVAGLAHQTACATAKDTFIDGDTRTTNELLHGVLYALIDIASAIREGH